MKILITGLNNYLARKVALCFVQSGFDVAGLIRSRRLFRDQLPGKSIDIIEGDLFRGENLSAISVETAVAFYFNQRTAPGPDMHIEMELIALGRYIDALKATACKQLIYVTKLVDDNVDRVNDFIRATGMNYTIIRTSNIIGDGSVLMNILTKMSTQRFIVVSKEFAKSLCQPVYVADICAYFMDMLLDARTYGQLYDIGGPEIVTYKELFERYIEVMNIPKKIRTLPKLGKLASAFMIRYVYRLERDISTALNLNVRQHLICNNSGLQDLYPRKLMSFREALPFTLGLADTGK